MRGEAEAEGRLISAPSPQLRTISPYLPTPPYTSLHLPISRHRLPSCALAGELASEVERHRARRVARRHLVRGRGRLRVRRGVRVSARGRGRDGGCVARAPGRLLLYLDLPTSPYSPYIFLYLPTSPCTSLSLPTSPCTSLHLPTSPCTSLHLPTPPYISLYLVPYTSLHLPVPGRPPPVS